MLKVVYLFVLPCLLLLLLACRVPAASNPPASAAAPSSPTPFTPTAPYYPFPQHLTYAGSIRPNHVSQAQQDDDVRAFYTAWKDAYLKAAGQTPAGYPL